MATIKLYTKKDGTKAYMFNVYLGKHPITGKPMRTTKRGFKSEKQARLALSKIELDIADGKYTKIEKEKPKKTFEQIYWSWYEEYKTTVKESTLLKTERTFRNHILPAFGDKYIDEIKPLEVQEQMNKWHTKLVRSREVMNYTGSVFDYAMRFELINSNPTKLIRKPVHKKQVKEDKDLNFYDKDELKEFLRVAESMANERAFIFFRLLAFTGIRKGEALALRWSDVNFSGKVLTINKAVSRREKGLYIQTPKTASSIRRISMDDKTLDYLKKFKIETESVDDDLIFRTDIGGILSQSKSRKWLIVIQDEIDKQREKPMKRITTHGFRHTHASLLFESGASLKEVQFRLGHSDIQTTMDIYTHISKSAKEKLAEKFNEFVDF